MLNWIVWNKTPKRTEKQNTEKRNTTDPNTIKQMLTQENKMVNEENHDWKEYFITIPQKPRMEKSLGRNRKD